MVAAAVGLAMDQEPQQQHPSSDESLKVLRKHRFATPISHILPDDFVLDGQSASSPVTIEDALSHRTGFCGADNLYGRWMGAQPKGITKALRFLGGPNEALRTRWQYNNLMYSVVGDVLEMVTGMQWGAALRKLLWLPLGLSSTFWSNSEIPNDKKEALARGYFWVPSISGDNTKGEYIPERYLDFAGIAPAGSVISNVTDFTIWIGALLKAAKGHEVESETQRTPDSGEEQTNIITPRLFADMTTPRIVDPLPPTLNKNSHLTPRTYSLGWFNMSSTMGFQHPIIAHGGGLNGFGTMLYLLPNDDFGVVTLGNTTLSSHLVGEAVVSEFMARKLDLQESAKVQFIQSLSNFDAIDQLTALAEQASELTQSEVVDGDKESRDARLTESFINGLVGTYNHPAYGPFHVSWPQGLKRARIIYGLQVLRKDRKELETHRDQTQTLVVEPVGHHTWGNQFVLHARTSDKTDCSKNTEEGVIFFDLEVLALHGEEVPSEETLRSSSSEPQEATSMKSVWESQRLCRRGAALKRASKAEEPATTSTALQLGLRLSNAYLGKDGTNDDGWEAEMAWFTLGQ